MDEKPVDERDAIYRDLHAQQLEADEGKNRHAAQVILGMLFKEFMPKSVLDVGCGLGTWLSVAHRLGVGDVLGVDGSWLDKARLRISEDLVRILDLEKSFDLGRRFDMAICLEVAEHLDAKAAAGFVASLTAHADIILFSAAIPLQGGHHHVNEQWPAYWCTLFEEQGFETLDAIRAPIWTDNSIHVWLRQNALLIVKKHLATGDGIFSKLLKHTPPLSIVHPEVYLLMLQQAQAALAEHNKIVGLLSAGGTFNVRKESNGRITIARV
jgi:SAM-dependent methyltransferase